MALLPEHFPGEKILIRLWETVERFGTGLASPMQIRRTGKARTEIRRYEMLSDAQTKKDADDVMAGRLKFDTSSGKLISAIASEEAQGKKDIELFVAHHNETILLTEQTREKVDSIYRLLNLRRIIAMAEEQMEITGSTTTTEEATAADNTTTTEETDQSIDPDWAYRWKERASQISTEEMQRLWAKILAGECNNPGSYSLRTLDLLFLLGKKKQNGLLWQQRFVFMEISSIVKQSISQKEDLHPQWLMSYKL
jgi:hypothetical protein